MDGGPSSRNALLDRALRLFQQGYEHQMSGELDEAAALYQASIGLFPTAEAHTFLAWTYSFQGRLDDAIRECQRAIEVDPEFGNAYNDIGAYLIGQGKHDEAIPWLERALRAGRYESYHFPWFNWPAFAAWTATRALSASQSLAIAPETPRRPTLQARA
jgi:Tfp pilus assembly protein PilF